MNDPFLTPLDNEIDTGYAETHADLLGDVDFDLCLLKQAHHRLKQRGLPRSMSPNDTLDRVIASANDADCDGLTPDAAFGFDDDDDDDDDDDAQRGFSPVE